MQLKLSTAIFGIVWLINVNDADNEGNACVIIVVVAVGGNAEDGARQTTWRRPGRRSWRRGVVENNAKDDDADADTDGDGWLDAIKITKNIDATKRRRQRRDDIMQSQYEYCGLLLVDIAENEYRRYTSNND